MRSNSKYSYFALCTALLSFVAIACSNDAATPPMGDPSTAAPGGSGAAGTAPTTGQPSTAGSTTTATAGTSTSGGSGGTPTAGATSGTGASSATAGSPSNQPAAGSSGSPTTSAGGGADAGGGGTAGAAPMTNRLEPSIRNPKYKSLAPQLGEPLPIMTPGAWTFTAIDGAVSRDGSPAGFYYKGSKTGNKNLLIYLVGGGVCADGFFCNMNPANKDQSLTAENVLVGVGNLLGPDAEPQDPNGARWQSGIFKDDPANPARDWNMVFIPYVTGDVFFGSKPNGTVPDVEGTFQFVGKQNMLKFISRIVPTFRDAEIIVLAGSSAGGIGSLLNAPFLADAYIDLGKGARVFVLDDAGPFFDDAELEVCIQKRYRDIFGLDQSFPEECTGCRSADGGGLVKGYLAYLADKYPDRVLGGLVDSDQDEIMKFFFSEGLENCGFIENPVVGLLAYPADRYPAGLRRILNELVEPSRMASYIWAGDSHQNLFQTATADRFYEKNGLEKSVAEWFSSLISGKNERIGVIK